MQNQYQYQNSNVLQIDSLRGFKKSTANPAFEENLQIQTQFGALPPYSQKSYDFQTGKQPQNYFKNQPIEIKSPKSLTSFASITYNQRPTSAVDSYTNIKSKEEQRMKVMYEGISFQGKRYDTFTPQYQLPARQYQNQIYPVFSKYSKGQGNNLNRAKSISQTAVPKEDTFIMGSHNGLSFKNEAYTPKPSYQYKNRPSQSQYQQNKSKLLCLQRELTQMSLEKGQLILQLADLSRQNIDMKNQLVKLRQNHESSSVQMHKVNNTRKVQIDQGLLLQIQHISQQQKQINKIKEQYIQLASAGYQNEIKRLIKQNNSLKIQIQSLNFDLTIAKQDLADKQVKFDFLQREKNKAEQKATGSSKVQQQMTEKYNQIIALRHALGALESKYKAQAKQLANKQDYILKYIVGRGGNEDLQAIKGLVSHFNPHARRIEDMSQIQSQLQSNSQTFSVNAKNSGHR